MKAFFHHYNKPQKKISVHYDGKCYIVDELECKAATTSKFNNKQPYFVMKGKTNKLDYFPKQNKIVIN